MSKTFVVTYRLIGEKDVVSHQDAVNAWMSEGFYTVEREDGTVLRINAAQIAWIQEER